MECSKCGIEMVKIKMPEMVDLIKKRLRARGVLKKVIKRAKVDVIACQSCRILVLTVVDPVSKGPEIQVDVNGLEEGVIKCENCHKIIGWNFTVPKFHRCLPREGKNVEGLQECQGMDSSSESHGVDSQ